MSEFKLSKQKQMDNAITGYMPTVGPSNVGRTTGPFKAILLPYTPASGRTTSNSRLFVVIGQMRESTLRNISVNVRFHIRQRKRTHDR